MKVSTLLYPRSTKSPCVAGIWRHTPAGGGAKGCGIRVGGLAGGGAGRGEGWKERGEGKRRRRGEYHEDVGGIWHLLSHLEQLEQVVKLPRGAVRGANIAATPDESGETGRREDGETGRRGRGRLKNGSNSGPARSPVRGCLRTQSRGRIQAGHCSPRPEDPAPDGTGNCHGTGGGVRPGENPQPDVCFENLAEEGEGEGVCDFKQMGKPGSERSKDTGCAWLGVYGGRWDACEGRAGSDGGPQVERGGEEFRHDILPLGRAS